MEMRGFNDHPDFDQYVQEALQSADNLLSGKATRYDFALEYAHRVIGARITDPRTGLLNPEGLNIFLKRAIHDALTFRRPLSLIYIDGRHFGEINNVLGHEVGHQVIASIGRALEELRKGDIRARIAAGDDVELAPNISNQSREGGDEFIVVCFEGLRNTVKLAQRLKREVPDRVHKDVRVVKERIPGGFQISSGVAELRRHSLGRGAYRAEDPAEFIGRAEARMYAERAAESSWLRRVRHWPLHISDAFQTSLEHVHGLRHRL